MHNDIDLVKKQLKDNIQQLIDSGSLNEARQLIEQYKSIAREDVEAYSMDAVVLIMEGKLQEAEGVLKEGLNIDEKNFDLNYNLGYVYEQAEKFNLALGYYEKANSSCNDEKLKEQINSTINEIKNKYQEAVNDNRLKLVFFVKQGMDSFLGDIINGLSDEYIIKKIVVTDYKQIDEGMAWANICWFEWCDELVIYGSKLPLAREKKIICRLHSYEAFTDYPSKVDWDKVDKLIFIAEYIKKFVSDKIKIHNKKLLVIPNGIDVNKWRFVERKHGFNVAYVGYINYKKGPMLLLQTFKAIYDKDHRYKLYIAGKFQDDRDVLYFKQMIKEFGIEKNVIYEGWQNNLDEWLENKNYILCTSILESQNVSVMQAMAKGIKPIVHNFVGAKNVYPKEYVWNTIDGAVHMIQSGRYCSNEYRKYILDNYSSNQQIEKIEQLIRNIKSYVGSIVSFEYDRNLKGKPLITIGITNYNGKQYLKKCIESFLDQTYLNIELLLIDDCSTDGSREIIQAYEKKYKNVRGIYHKVNSGGASKGIQEIIKNSRGEYFQWIACDDFVEKDAVEIFVKYLEKNSDKDYVYSDFNIVNENNVKTGEWNYKELDYKQVIQHIFYNNASGIIPMNCMYRLDFFKKNNINWIIYKNNDFSCDTINSLQFIKHKWNYGRIDSCLINYRIHSNNLSNNLEKRNETSITIFDYIINNFSEEIYFSQVNWNNVENRVQFKNYLIANFYYKQILNLINIKPNVVKEENKQHYCLFIKEGMSYIDKGLEMGMRYEIELNQLKSKFYKLHEVN